MLYAYCRSCKQESPGDACPLCGRRVPASSLRDVWNIILLPIADGRAWLSAMYALLAAAGLLIVLIFGLEALLASTERAVNLWQGNLLSLILWVVPLGLAVTGLFLLLQGRETALYILDHQGAHLQTWHKPSRIRSWARLQSFDPWKNIPQADGTVMCLSQERHILWPDVQQVKYAPRRASILLYHTPRCAPLVLRLPPEEYELAEAFVKKHCKNK